MPGSPASFIEDALSVLQRSLQDHGSDLRNVQLATVSADGAPDVRTLVLRDFAWPPGRMEMHTDARAAKVPAVEATRRVALLSWSAEEQLQLRFSGTARLHRDDEITRDRWERLSERGRGAYGTVATPGAAIPDPADRALLAPDEQYLQFGVLLITLDAVDVLRLGPDGRQTRATGRFDADAPNGRWVSA